MRCFTNMSKQTIKQILLGIIIGLIIVVTVAYGGAAMLSAPTPPVASTTSNRQDQSVAEMAAQFIKVYTANHVAGLEAFNDSGLMNFYENDLQKTCPYYVPDGSTYRDCLVTLEQKEKSRVKNQSAISTADTYCSSGATKTADDTSLGYIDIYNTCMLYRLNTTSIPKSSIPSPTLSQSETAVATRVCAKMEKIVAGLDMTPPLTLADCIEADRACVKLYGPHYVWAGAASSDNVPYCECDTGYVLGSKGCFVQQ